MIYSFQTNMGGKAMQVFETERITLRLAAVISGITMIIMVFCAMFAVGFVDSRLMVYDDATATVNNIRNSMSLFNAGIFSWLLILICDMILSWSLFIFLKQINRSLSLLGLLFRCIVSRSSLIQHLSITIDILI